MRIDPSASAFTPLAFVNYPWSHSLLMSFAWGGVAALLAVRSSAGRRGALLVGLVVVSHWVLDWITHVPDLPLWPGSPKFGLGLWQSVAATIVVEGAVFAGAIAMYSRAAPARDAAGRWSFRALVLIVTAIWVSGPFSPPPPSVSAIVVVSLLLAVVFPMWAAHIDRHRAVVP